MPGKKQPVKGKTSQYPTTPARSRERDVSRRRLSYRLSVSYACDEQLLHDRLPNQQLQPNL